MTGETSSSDRKGLFSQNIENSDRSFSCGEELVRITNLMISTAFSNRFLSEISSHDEALQEVSSVLGRLASIYHLLGRELISFMMKETHGTFFHHYDPLLPEWNSEMRMVYEGNKQMVDELRIFLAKLKIHGHTRLRSFVKSNIRKSGLTAVLDELEQLIAEEWGSFAEQLERDATRSEVQDDFEPSATSTPRKRGERDDPDEGTNNNNIKVEPVEQKEENIADSHSQRKVKIAINKSSLALPRDLEKNTLLVDSPDVKIWISDFSETN